MASENLVNDLFEIVQSNTKEKLSYDDFEKDLIKSINLPNDEMDRALSIMLSQAEVNPNVIGESKGGMFVLSPSFSASVVSTIKYENQFIEGKLENINRNSNNNIKADFEAAVLIMTPGLKDAMIMNYESLSSEERTALWNNFRYCTDEEKKKINEAHAKAIYNKANNPSTPESKKDDLYHKAETVETRNSILEAAKKGELKAIQCIIDTLSDYRTEKHDLFIKIMNGDVDLEHISVKELIERYEVFLEGVSKAESSIVLEGKEPEDVEIELKLYQPQQGGITNKKNNTYNLAYYGDTAITLNGKSGGSNDTQILSGEEVISMISVFDNMVLNYEKNPVEPTEVAEMFYEIAQRTDTEAYTEGLLQFLDIHNEIGQQNIRSKKLLIERYKSKVAELGENGTVSSQVLSVLKEIIEMDFGDNLGNFLRDSNGLLKHVVSQMARDPQSKVDVSKFKAFNPGQITDFQLESAKSVKFEFMSVATERETIHEMFGTEDRETHPKTNEELLSDELYAEKSEKSKLDNVSEVRRITQPFFDPSTGNYGDIFGNVPMSQILGHVKEIRKIEKDEREKIEDFDIEEEEQGQ